MFTKSSVVYNFVIKKACTAIFCIPAIMWITLHAFIALNAQTFHLAQDVHAVSWTM